MKKTKILSKANNTLRHLQGKRRLANLDACQFDLSEQLDELFAVFDLAVQKSGEILSEIPVEARAKGCEVGILNSCFAEFALRAFGNNVSYAKNRRFVIHLNGYLILFKKLDKKGMPMNIKTNSVSKISKQQLSIHLFSETGYEDAPILHFGYQVNNVGAIESPRLIYIDEGRIQFMITDIREKIQVFDLFSTPDVTDTVEISKPKLKITHKIKKAN